MASRARVLSAAAGVGVLFVFCFCFAGAEGEQPPLLASGWRAELVGHLIEELISGKKSIRIEDPLSEHPLAFDSVGGDDTMLEGD